MYNALCVSYVYNVYIMHYIIYNSYSFYFSMIDIYIVLIFIFYNICTLYINYIKHAMGICNIEIYYILYL